jgi:ThiF family
MDTSELFQRVITAYDLERLNQCRIIYVGTGGAASFIEDMTRAGVGEHILIDPDVVSASNIATQQTYVKDIGRPKVECIAERIREINPDAYVETYQKAIDEIDDQAFARLTRWVFLWGKRYGGPGPERTLLCGLTDNFYAQARVNRLSLKFYHPSLCAQLYQYGQAAEISFTYPGVTPACQRCMLSPRYRAYLERGYQNTATSDGAPIFTTTRVNALKGMIAMALLHHGTNHPLWGELLTRIGNRTLVQIRMHPDAPLTTFSKVFAGGDTERIFFDEAVWLPQEADPTCPECGGTGDMFADTRQWK